MIKDDDLGPAFRRALDTFDDSRPFGANNVRIAWYSIRAERAAEPPPRILDADACYYCNGSGWQCVAVRSASGNENTALRPCACSKAPEVIHSAGSSRDRTGDVIAQRSAEPLREPEYRKRTHTEIWERVANATR